MANQQRKKKNMEQKNLLRFNTNHSESQNKILTFTEISNENND